MPPSSTSSVTPSASVADVLILLPDGMQNVDPYYDTPAVKGVIEPSDTIVHTIGVGPELQVCRARA